MAILKVEDRNGILASTSSVTGSNEKQPNTTPVTILLDMKNSLLMVIIAMLCNAHGKLFDVHILSRELQTLRSTRSNLEFTLSMTWSIVP